MIKCSIRLIQYSYIDTGLRFSMVEIFIIDIKVKINFVTLGHCACTTHFNMQRLGPVISIAAVTKFLKQLKNTN